jgi:hypothetical protein
MIKRFCLGPSTLALVSCGGRGGSDPAPAPVVAAPLGAAMHLLQQGIGTLWDALSDWAGEGKFTP